LADNLIYLPRDGKSLSTELKTGRMILRITAVGGFFLLCSLFVQAQETSAVEKVLDVETERMEVVDETAEIVSTSEEVADTLSSEISDSVVLELRKEYEVKVQRLQRMEKLHNKIEREWEYSRSKRTSDRSQVKKRFERVQSRLEEARLEVKEAEEKLKLMPEIDLENEHVKVNEKSMEENESVEDLMIPKAIFNSSPEADTPKTKNENKKDK